MDTKGHYDGRVKLYDADGNDLIDGAVYRFVDGVFKKVRESNGDERRTD